MPSLQPVHREFLDEAPQRIVESVDIRAGRADAWTAICDQPGWVDWFPGLERVEADPEIWTAPGDTRTVHIGRLVVREEAIVVDSEHEWGFAILSWPLPGFRRGAEAIRLADGPDGGTTLTYVGAFELNLIGQVMWPVLRGRLASSWKTAFTSLDDLTA